MNPHAGLVTEENPSSVKGDSKKNKGLILYIVLAAIVVFVLVFWILGAIGGDSKKSAVSTNKDTIAQKKYQQKQQKRMQQKADRLKDVPLVVKNQQEDKTSVDTMLQKLERDREIRIKAIRKEQEKNGGKAKLLKQILNTGSHKTPPENTNPIQQKTRQLIKTASGQRPYYKVSGKDPDEQRLSYEIQKKNDELDRETMFAYSRHLKTARVYEPPQKKKTQNRNFFRNNTHTPPTRTQGQWKSAKDENPPITTVLYTKNKPVKLFEGEFIDCVLLNKIVSDTEESPVVCAVSRDVIDNSGEWVVIPANTRIIGKSAKVTYMGASRMFISFERMILPGGESIHFPYNKKALKALDETGALGAVSDVNRHWLLQFGAALWIGVLDGLGGAAQNRVDQNSGTSYVISRTNDNFGKILDTIMQRYTNIVPTITVWQGSTMKVYLSDDVLISPFCRVQERSYANQN